MVHLWVEGFFEVFATVVIAFLFTRLKLLSISDRDARVSVLDRDLSFGRHHRDIPSSVLLRHAHSVLALGRGVQRAEVVPLVLIGFEAWENIRLSRGTADSPWVSAYKWPIYFFVAVAFWNLVGAGLFGFMINPPIALYYMQGLNTTPVHGHAALFGVYGMLGIGLMLFCLRALRPGQSGKTVRWRSLLVDQHRACR